MLHFLMNAVEKMKHSYLSVVFLLLATLLLFASGALSRDLPPHHEGQPEDGPGSKRYVHKEVIIEGHDVPVPGDARDMSAQAKTNEIAESDRLAKRHAHRSDEPAHPTPRYVPDFVQKRRMRHHDKADHHRFSRTTQGEEGTAIKKDLPEHTLVLLEKACPVGRTMLPLISTRAAALLEENAFLHFIHVADHVDAESHRLRKDHSTLTCDEVKTIMAHDLVTEYSQQLLDAGKGGKDMDTLEATVKALMEGKTQLREQEALSEEDAAVITEIAEAAGRFQKQALVINEAVKQVAQSMEDKDCSANFANFIEQAHSINVEEVPDWDAAVHNLEQFLIACNEAFTDKNVKAENVETPAQIEPSEDL